MLVIQGPVEDNVIKYEVIDGQQRLTTISLLFAALYSRLLEFKEPLGEERFYDVVRPLRYRLVLKTDKHKTRVVPQIQNMNLEDFRWLLKEYANLDCVIQKPSYFGVRKIAKAYKYFYDRLGADIEGKSGEDAIQVLLDRNEHLCNAVLVQITVDNQADAYTLFASLNNRGEPLSAVDLIKNSLLANIAGDDEQKLDYYFGVWQEVLRNLGPDYTVQERFFRQNYDAFRRTANKPFLKAGTGQLPLGSVATCSNLLRIYEQRIQLPGGAVEVLNELIEHSKIYSQIIGVNRDDLEATLSARLTELSRAQGVSSYLLLLFLMKKRDKPVMDLPLIAATIQLLVCFFVRRNLTDTPPTRDLERLFISICESIEDQNLSGMEAAQYIKQRLVATSADDDIFKECLEGPVYDINPDITRYILATLASPSVTREMKGLWDQNSKGYIWTIEHILPQGDEIPQEWLEMIAAGDKNAAKEIQTSLVHTLGNLTITGYNSKLSNMPFVKKRDRKNDQGANIGYRNGLNLNEDLIQTDVWTKEQIEARTRKLVKAAMEAFAFDSVDFHTRD